MPTLIRLDSHGFRLGADTWTTLEDGEDLVPGPVIVSPARFAAEREALLSGNRPVGMRLLPDDDVEPVAEHLPELALVALEFPKFRDGRAYSAAQLLRERYGFTGELRAVGDVLLEQGFFMVRCGFNAFKPSDGSTAEDWARVAGRHRHVYQASADGRAPAFAERGS